VEISATESSADTTVLTALAMLSQSMATRESAPYAPLKTVAVVTAGRWSLNRKQDARGQPRGSVQSTGQIEHRHVEPGRRGRRGRQAPTDVLQTAAALRMDVFGGSRVLVEARPSRVASTFSAGTGSSSHIGLELIAAVTKHTNVANATAAGNVPLGSFWLAMRRVRPAPRLHGLG